MCCDMLLYACKAMVIRLRHCGDTEGPSGGSTLSPSPQLWITLPSPQLWINFFRFHRYVSTAGSGCQEILAHFVGDGLPVPTPDIAAVHASPDIL